MAEAPTTLAQAHNSTKAFAAQAKLRATMSRPLQRVEGHVIPASEKPTQERNSTPPRATWQQDGIVFAHADMSGASCCQRLIRPAIAAPRMGASQNSQSCAM